MGFILPKDELVQQILLTAIRALKGLPLVTCPNGCAKDVKKLLGNLRLAAVNIYPARQADENGCITRSTWSFMGTLAVVPG